MPTSSSMGVGAAGLAALLGGSLAIGSALSASAAPSPSGHQSVLRLTGETTQFAVIDVGDEGPALGLGDQIISSDRLLRSGQTVGRAGTVLTVVGTDRGTLSMHWLTTLDLPEGQLVLQGIGDGPTGAPTTPLTVSVAVTGGTGAFKAARGSAEIIDRPGGTEMITVRLTR